MMRFLFRSGNGRLSTWMILVVMLALAAPVFAGPVLAGPVLAGPVFAAQENEARAAQENAAKELVGGLDLTLEASFKAEQKTIKVYEERLARAERERVYMAAAANGYQLKLSTFGNLLLSAGVDLSLLQKTRAEIKASLLEISKMTQDLARETEAISAEKANLTQQKELVATQIKELAKLAAKNTTPSVKQLEKTARQLEALLKDKEAIIAKLEKIYLRQLEVLQKLTTAFSGLASQFDTALEQRKTQNLFERQDQILGFRALKAFGDDLSLLAGKLKALFLPESWIAGLKTLWQSAGLVPLSLAVVLYGITALLIRIRKALGQGETLAAQMGPWNSLALILAGHSILPGGIALTLYLYSGLDKLFSIAPFLRCLAILLLIYLAQKWAETAFTGHAKGILGTETAVKKLVGLCRVLALFSTAYLPLYETLGQESALLVALRLTGALVLLAWVQATWRAVRLASLKTQDRHQAMRDLGIKYLLTLISGVTLLLDMTGYGSLSFHWLLSWAKTLPIAFWWWILLAMLQEWDHYYRKKSSTHRNELLYDDYPVQWLLIRAGQLIWMITLTALLLLAWGNRQTVLAGVYDFLAYPLTVGSMSFSLMGLIMASLVITLTYALTRVWKWIFQTKFLSKSGMEVGLQDSITSITIYMIWSLGILISLHLFGLNTASLAVAFGALGIGLGFGLQNIFNNFISGIILLFERPIQVGDDVEINGTWARVKKINVRSTVVQTYDNASLIIPNADFISSQVTNWSFKDKRIRRTIVVGVAYGSDTRRVKETLLEIAAKTHRVLKVPKPEVLFSDFADSALVFKLRVWTDIDHMMTVETDIRFEIDRLFRERSIEISFPQRDIHIRTAPGLASAADIHPAPAPGKPGQFVQGEADGGMATARSRDDL